MHFNQEEDHVLLPRVFCVQSSCCADHQNHQKPKNCPAAVLHHKLQPKKTMVMMKMMMIATSSSHLRLKS